MAAKLAKAFVGFQMSIGLIQEEDASIYQYGYIVMAEMALNIIISISLGIWLGQVKGILFFLCMFLPLRSYCGGYHADKAWKCVLLSNMVAVGVVEMAKWDALYLIPQWVKNLVFIACSIIVICLSPVDNENRKLSVCEKKVYRRYAIVILVMEILLGAALLFAGNINFYHIVLLSHAVQAVSLVCAFINAMQ